LAIEAKLTSQTLVKALGSNRADPNNSWLMPQYHPNVYRAVIPVLSDGDASKAFITSGGQSNHQDTKTAWEKLRDAGILMFYIRSFSFKWGHDMTKENREIKAENREIKERLVLLENALKKLPQQGNIK
jgi:hypothetical protein